MNDNSIGATLRIDLPRQPGQEVPYARTVAKYLTSDTKPHLPPLRRLHQRTLPPGTNQAPGRHHRALTRVLAEQGITIRDGLFVGDETFSPYDGEPGTRLALPVSSTQTSAINAEFIYRGSLVRTHRPHHAPDYRPRSSEATAVEHHMETIRSQPTNAALQQGRRLWADMLDSKTFPSDDDCQPWSHTSNSQQRPEERAECATRQASPPGGSSAEAWLQNQAQRKLHLAGA